eukprot:SAG11_NODE_1623_length_4559_cov_2.141480_1_plen_163_part_00
MQQILQRLRCCRGLERLSEKDLRDMEWAKQEKIFVMLFMRIGVKALHNCAAERIADKKPMSAVERRQTEEAFQVVFQKLVLKHLQIAGYAVLPRCLNIRLRCHMMNADVAVGQLRLRLANCGCGCLPARPPARQPARPPACLPTCLSVHLPMFLDAGVYQRC